MKKCCFIIPYFGKLPNYFQLFLKSCEYNPDFNWILFTDDYYKFNYPQNVKVVYTSFEKLRKRVAEKFDFPISLEKPYKLCDYKPAYGYLFEDYLAEYKAWGHCDVDLLFGKLSDYITEDDLDFYDKMFCLGHLIIYKNTFENNRLFMSDYKGKKLFKEAFTTNKIFVFDEAGKKEENINSIFLSQHKNIYLVDHSLNINTAKIKFRRTTYKGKQELVNTSGFECEPYRDSVYLWNEGKVQRYYLLDSQIVLAQFPYIHLQKRNMSLDTEICKERIIQIIPNKFVKFKYGKVTRKNFYHIIKHDISFDYYYARLKEMLGKHYGCNF